MLDGVLERGGVVPLEQLLQRAHGVALRAGGWPVQGGAERLTAGKVAAGPGRRAAPQIRRRGSGGRRRCHP